jgi:required for meiotic nuclear division protein 1
MKFYIMHNVMTSKKHIIAAYRIAEKISIRNLNNIDVILEATIIRKSSEEMELHTSDEFRIYIFNFGTIAFFNCPKIKQRQIINRIAKEFPSAMTGLQVDFYAISDSMQVRVDDKAQVDFDLVRVPSLDNDALRIVAMILSHSVIIDYYEQHVENLLELSNANLIHIRKRWRLPTVTQKLTNFLVECMITKQQIISNLFVLDSPDEIWENPELDTIYKEMKKMLEISPRFKSLDYKLKLIQENLSVIVELSSTRSNLWLELIIVLLILFEILMALAKLT